MKKYQQQFIQFMLDSQALSFGDFVLKSGRQSPYFFNAGAFNTGREIATLASYYAETIEQSAITLDVLFGPAYKGIPLATATALMLNNQYKKNIGFAFNRKEKKDHGEGGQLAGADMSGKRVLLIDDVVTAGTAVQEVMPLLKAVNAKVIGLVITFNRQEIGQTTVSAIEEIQQRHHIPVLSIVNLADIIEFLQKEPRYHKNVQAMINYQREYGV